MNDTYLNWVCQHTPTKWWHDSAAVAELDLGLQRGASGVTTNPVLLSAALRADRASWAAEIDEVLARRLPPEAKAEALMRIAVTSATKRLLPTYHASHGRAGLVCAQVNPLWAGDREAMRAMAARLYAWAPNVVVKLPATAAGLDVLEECVAEGITVAATLSFTVAQVLASAERHRAGCHRARANGITPGRCFSVLMIGRVDDYLREIALDGRAPVSEADLRQAGLAISKRAYALFQKRQYEAVLMVAALRGTYHLTELAGADLVMSIHPKVQQPFISQDFPRQVRIDGPVPAEVIERLRTLPDFVRAYEPDALAPSDFLAYGTTQRTLSQFIDAGWRLIESYL